MEESSDPLVSPTKSSPLSDAPSPLPRLKPKSHTQAVPRKKRPEKQIVPTGDDESDDELALPRPSKRPEVVLKEAKQTTITKPMIHIETVEIDDDMWVESETGGYRMKDGETLLDEEEDIPSEGHEDVTIHGTERIDDEMLVEHDLGHLDPITESTVVYLKSHDTKAAKEEWTYEGELSQFEDEPPLELSDGEFVPHTSDDELNYWIKPVEDQQDIEDEIQELYLKVPKLKNSYEIVDRLGTGTFSSVYKAIDLHYHDLENRFWESPEAQQDPSKPVYVAIKRILVTSSPRRILNELLIMETCRGCRHVAQIITAYRREDQIVAVMPYQRSVDIKELMSTLNIKLVREYFRCMFRALRDIHARGIIHRDLKPANFLFDPLTMTGTMLDFGLAEVFDYEPDGVEKETGCLHTGPTPKYPHGRLREGQKHVLAMRKAVKMSIARSEQMPENVGWPTDDVRPGLKANRAGTRGFRAPEVLFKCNAQTPAIDIWSAGTILLFFLTQKCPIFSAPSDMHALMEQALIIGRGAMERCAAVHCRTFSTNIPEIKDRIPWSKFVTKLNPKLFDSLPVRLEPPETPEEREQEEMRKLVVDALDLLEKCLEPFSFKRITARDALYHPFLKADAHEIAQARAAYPEYPTELEDDEFFPHPFGQGICGQHHQIDSNGDCKVFIGLDPEDESHWIPVEAGEGQAIGSQPCEFHRVYVYS